MRVLATGLLGSFGALGLWLWLALLGSPGCFSGCCDCLCDGASAAGRCRVEAQLSTGWGGCWARCKSYCSEVGCEDDDPTSGVCSGESSARTLGDSGEQAP